ncbi:MAG: hypothetical protein EBX52_07380, partial [Proteobacteria bacterium]|nr:hypothetical protein [Pseudomonadota bacterium]
RRYHTKTDSCYPFTMNLPAGWYVILDSREVGKKPLGIRRFGLPLVASRKGDAYILILKGAILRSVARSSCEKGIDGDLLKSLPPDLPSTR